MTVYSRVVRLRSPLVIAAVLGCAAAHAEGVAPSIDDEVKKHFGLGNDLYGEGRYADALVEYDEAYRLSKNWRVLYNRGQCLVMVRREPEAIEAFERYLAEGGDQVPEARRAAVTEDVQKLRARLGQIALDGAPPNHDVFVDGRMVAATPLAKPLTVGAGSHELAVRAKGQAVGFVTTIDVVAGTTRRITMTAPAQAPVPAPAPTIDSRGFHPSPAFDLALALGVSVPTLNFVKARLDGLGFAELGASFRIDPLWEVGAYAGLAAGKLSLASDVAQKNSVQPDATYDYSTLGVRMRLHFARTRRWDLWGGLEVAAWRERFSFAGVPDAKLSFQYDATSIAPSLSGGIDYPIGERWMLGGTSRLTFARAAEGTRYACGSDAACDGGLPGISSGLRSYFDFAGRVTWIVPM